MGGLHSEDVVWKVTKSMDNFKNLCKFKISPPHTKLGNIDEAKEFIITTVPLMCNQF